MYNVTIPNTAVRYIRKENKSQEFSSKKRVVYITK